MGKLVDQAILKVTYMLSSISGVEKAENKKVFKEITKGFTWFSPGDPETDKFVLEIIKTTEELASLKEHYDDDDYFSAFMSKIEQECQTIMFDSNATVRKAFVIWTAICLADKELSEFENKTLLAIQRYMNFGSFIKEESDDVHKPSSITESDWDLLLRQRRTMGLIVGRGQKEESNDVLETQGKLIVSDSFKQEVLETFKLMGELKAQIDSTSDEDQKNSLQLSYDILQRQLESKILND